MQNYTDKWLYDKLEERRARKLWRSLQVPGKGLDFTSNDYLGLAQSEELFEEIQEKIQSLPKRNGSTGSRLLSGNSLYTEQVEKKLSDVFNSDATLIFNSGYSANLAVLSSIPQKGDTIIYDEFAHSSIKDGARLSLAKRLSFRHNDLNDLEQKIKHGQGRVFIAVESLYSMDGDECPLRDLTSLADKHDASIILDEAHSTGVLGGGGSGLAVSLKLEHKIAARIYTFGKALGIHGACVAGSQSLIDYLVNFARPFIYTTAPPPHSIVAIECAIDFLKKNMHLQSVLRSKIQLFLTHVRYENRVLSTSAIQTFVVCGNDSVKRAALSLQERGYDVRPILSPTVPKNRERLRICLHVFNHDLDITTLAGLLNSQEIALTG